MATVATNASTDLMLKSEVAALLRCTERQVERLAKSGRIPQPVYLGSQSPRWVRSDLLAALGMAADTSPCSASAKTLSPPSSARYSLVFLLQRKPGGWKFDVRSSGHSWPLHHPDKQRWWLLLWILQWICAMVIK
jgi:predicted DNA-binding transcriptional regulator AlpA